MTDTEDELLEQKLAADQLAAVWSFLSMLLAVMLALTVSPWMWVTATVCAAAFILQLVTIFWAHPRLRRRIWEQGEGWRCRRCSAIVEDGGCGCTESPSPWEPLARRYDDRDGTFDPETR